MKMKMKRPPIDAYNEIKMYCENTQCRLCIFGWRGADPKSINCSLINNTPCDWVYLEEIENDENK